MGSIDPAECGRWKDGLKQGTGSGVERKGCAPESLQGQSLFLLLKMRRDRAPPNNLGVWPAGMLLLCSNGVSQRGLDSTEEP